MHPTSEQFPRCTTLQDIREPQLQPAPSSDHSQNSNVVKYLAIHFSQLYPSMRYARQLDTAICRDCLTHIRTISRIESN